MLILLRSLPRLDASSKLNLAAWSSSRSFSQNTQTSQSNKFYAIRSGRETGIFFSWAETEKHVKGYQGAKFKGFADKKSANAWLKGEVYRGAKSDKDTTYVYVDGSYNENGQAGIGIHWEGLEDQKDLSERVPGNCKQTNNTAELFGIIRALELDRHPDRLLIVRTDSEYCINALTIHYQRHSKSKWKDLANGDLIAYAGLLIRKRAKGATLEKVAGHSNVYCNEIVDELAKKGAGLTEAPHRDFEADHRNLEAKDRKESHTHDVNKEHKEHQQSTHDFNKHEPNKHEPNKHEHNKQERDTLASSKHRPRHGGPSKRDHQHQKDDHKHTHA